MREEKCCFSVPAPCKGGSAHSAVLLQPSFDFVSTSQGVISRMFLKGLGEIAVPVVTAAEWLTGWFPVSLSSPQVHLANSDGP